MVYCRLLWLACAELIKTMDIWCIYDYSVSQVYKCHRSLYINIHMRTLFVLIERRAIASAFPIS